MAVIGLVEKGGKKKRGKKEEGCPPDSFGTGEGRMSTHDVVAKPPRGREKKSAAVRGKEKESSPPTPILKVSMPLDVRAGKKRKSR